MFSGVKPFQTGRFQIETNLSILKIMKKLCLIALVLFSKAAFAQKDTVGLHIPYANGSVVYEKVFKTAGKLQTELYKNAQQWLIERYKTERVIEITDTLTGKVIGKGKEAFNIDLALGNAVSFKGLFTIQIDCKDNKYRCRIYSINLHHDKGNSNDDEINTSPEEMVNLLLGKNASVPITKNQAKKLLVSLGDTVDNTMMSLYKTMADKQDF